MARDFSPGRLLRDFGGWKGLLALAGGAALCWSILGLDWPKQQRLREHGITADGWVVAKDLRDNRSVTYAFTAEGRSYTGVGIAGRGNVEFPDLAVGDRVLVFYLPQDPEVSTLGDPYEHLRRQNAVLQGLIVTVVAACLFIVRRELGRAPVP